jgi:bile acid-coenzyme A ligase
MRRPRALPPSYAYRGATPRTLPGGWESLGDIGWFDADGYLYLADRRTDMILVGGSNVYPAEIEAALDEHPLVAVQRRDRPAGRRPGQPHPRHRPAAARPHRRGLREHVAACWSPTSSRAATSSSTENIRDDAGKVRRSQLRAERVGG